jgi:DNA sulfur modification protein DndE
MMSIPNIKIVETDRDLLVRLKRTTGIKNWNVLCRWAFCLSLADPHPTSVDPIGTQSNVEMTWKVFAGSFADVYQVLLVQRCHEDGRQLDQESIEQEFNRHLHRGIGHLANISAKPSLRDLVTLVA